MPVLLAGRTGDDIAGADFLFRLAPALRPAETGRDDQCLPARMRVPGAACARLERHACAAELRWPRRLEQRIDPNIASEELFWSLARRLRTVALDAHLLLLPVRFKPCRCV